MAYATKYYTEWHGCNGVAYEIEIQSEDYDGDPMLRRMGAAPHLRMDRGDRIQGTSLEMTLECQVDEEFAEFYTTDPFAWRVILSYYAGNTKTLLWMGYISPELYSDPDIAVPYDVLVTATDGLGELKNEEFYASDVPPDAIKPHELGKNGKEIYSIISYCLSKTRHGLSTADDFRLVSDIVFNDNTNARYNFDLSVNLSSFDGKNCYEVLQSLLATYGAYMTYHRGRWWLVRENDLPWSDTNILPVKNWNYANVQGGYSIPALAGFATDLTDFPVGKLSRTVEPPVKSMEFALENNYADNYRLLDPYMERELGTAWRLDRGTVTHERFGDEWCYRLASPWTGYSFNRAGIYQEFTNAAPLTNDLFIRARVFGPCEGADWSQRDNVLLLVMEEFDSLTGVTRFLKRANANDWSCVWTEDYTELRLDLTLVNDYESDIMEFRLNFPCNAGREYKISLYGGNANETEVYECRLSVSESVAKFKYMVARVQLNNGARAALSREEIAFNTAENISQSDYQSNVAITDFGQIVTHIVSEPNEYATNRWLEFMAIDRALSQALPRLRITGTLYIAETSPALFIRKWLEEYYVIYQMRTYDFDLVESEADIELISVPHGSPEEITVEVTKEIE